MDPRTQYELIVSPDAALRAAELVTHEVRRAVASRGRCLLAVSGGRTPGPMFRHLAAGSSVPWDSVELFWTDERFVPHDDPDSNYGSALRDLIEPAGLNHERVHPWPVDMPAEDSARRYADLLREVCGGPPALDVTLLGVGEDGHIASLFPGTPHLHTRSPTVTTVQPGTGSQRLSLSLSTLNSSRVVVFLVTGEPKRPALEAMLGGRPSSGTVPPAALVTARDRLVLVTDIVGLEGERGPVSELGEGTAKREE